MGASLTATAQNTPLSQMEQLDRGVVAVRVGSANIVSWRFLGTDDEDNTRFDIKRNGVTIATNRYPTWYKDASGTVGAKYEIVTKVNGEETETSVATVAATEPILRLKLDRPAAGTNGGTYEPNDMSVGDVDGDGQYELFMKWYPSNAKDNSQGGITDNTIIDCYKVDWANVASGGEEAAQRLWRIDLGRNIRSGAHYTQFMVYDFDGDGKAEMMCKTGPGSLDGKGNYVNSVATDATIKAVSGAALYRSSDGRITGGQEWLTVFNGETGEAIHTIFYNPNRNMTYGGAADGSVNWGVGGKNDTGSYGNRGERYLAAVAYLDGPDQNPSGIFSRGYYEHAFIWAVDFDGQQLKQKWLSAHKTKTSYTLTTYDAEGKGTSKTYSGCKATGTNGIDSGTMYGNGNHNMSIADVDGDGCDEIVWGSAALNNDGTLLYGTGYGHGDAIHLADHCPDRPGLEVFQVHEDKLLTAWDLHDAATGEVIHAGGPEGQDNGRGMAGQFDNGVRGSLFWSSSDGSARSAVTGNVVSSNHGSSNFRTYWDGDLQEELFDGGKMDKWNGNGTTRLYISGKNLYDYNHSSTCNGTKATPNLQADILGDWREEVIMWSAEDYATLNIFTAVDETKYRMPTLMHDHTYRMGVCWQNTAYNQPPHLGYYLPDAMLPRLLLDQKEITTTVNEEMNLKIKTRYASVLMQSGYFVDDNTTRQSGMPEGLAKTIDYTAKSLTITGTPTQQGTYRFPIALTGMNSEKVNDTLTVHVTDGTSGIIPYVATSSKQPQQVYDLQGRQRNQNNPQRGLFIVRRGNKFVKVVK